MIKTHSTRVQITTVVTGATGHIGKEISRSLSRAGHMVFLVSSNEGNLSKFASELAAEGAQVMFKTCDLFREEDRINLAQHIESLKLNIVGLVNNAYSGQGGTIHSSTCEQFRLSYEIGLIAPFHLSQLLSPMMRTTLSQGIAPAIANISSMYGHISPDLSIYDSEASSNPPFYGATKAALLQLTRYCAVELGQLGIRCNSVSPGPIPNYNVQESNPFFVEKLKLKNPMSMIGYPVDVASAVTFLLSNEAKFINGADIRVDGGWTAW